MVSRYDNRDIGVNQTEQYRTVLERKNVKFIRQHFTPELRHPTDEEIEQLELVGEVWKLGDRLTNVADKYYGDVSKWWVIAWFNKKPTEAHFKIGDSYHIPLPLDQVMRYLGV